jgi:hypothetical protein
MDYLGEMLAYQFRRLPSQLGYGLVEIHEASVPVEYVDDIGNDPQQVHVAVLCPDAIVILPVQAFPDRGRLA